MENHWLLYAGGTGLAFLIAYLAVPLAAKLAFRLGAIDEPDSRKVHRKPMPRLGGLAIFAGFMAAVLVLVKVQGPYEGIIIGGIIIFLVGVLDDIFGLSPWSKLLGQVVAAAAAIHAGVNVHFMTNPFDGMIYLGKMSIPLTMLWIIGITNAVNLIDGLDGLAAGVSGIAALTLAIVALREDQWLAAGVAFILVGAVVGFLPHNFHPARIFMGDAGALFLGFVLSCLAVVGLAKSAAIISLFVPIVVLGIPIFDTLFAIVRRLNKKAPIFKPDREHLHHRLMALGYNHRQSVLIIYGVSIFFGAIAVILTYVTSPQATLILSVLLVLVMLGAGRVGIVSPRRREPGTLPGNSTRPMKM
ncbi:MAG: undecaprenyl/decaprenyl-phosphate alpha-N-acetylglucosaminyl 1-phosphate transferase [Syntrophomonadaceae bacterium]|nr:undecaprenyl/decaprenyl-phosphate alpha-N-acetylglucosaminyl 1-phosphate transferase [Syntrophomonadaceae bacterium]